MPITITRVSFQYDPNDIRKNNIIYEKDGYSNENQNYYSIYWFIMSYKKINWYKTNTVNTIASVLCAPIDACKWGIIISTNILIIPIQVIFHGPVVIYCTVYNSLRYLDDYLSPSPPQQ